MEANRPNTKCNQNKNKKPKTKHSSEISLSKVLTKKQLLESIMSVVVESEIYSHSKSLHEK